MKKFQKKKIDNEKIVPPTNEEKILVPAHEEKIVPPANEEKIEIHEEKLIPTHAVEPVHEEKPVPIHPPQEEKISPVQDEKIFEIYEEKKTDNEDNKEKHVVISHKEDLHNKENTDHANLVLGGEPAHESKPYDQHVDLPKNENQLDI